MTNLRAKTKRNAIRREGMPEVDEIVCEQPPES